MKKSLLSCNVGVNIESDEFFLEKILSNNFIRKYIPSPKIGNPLILSPLIKVTFSSYFNLIEDYPLYHYQGCNELDVLYLAQYLLERMRQEANMYTIHSSCAERKGKAIILFGWKDTGKTSVAINLAKNYAFNFVSEGVTVIDDNKQVIGRVHYLEEDNDFFKKKYHFSADCIDVNKICKCTQELCKVELFVYPQISIDNNIIEWTGTDKAKFHLFELFSMDIRGVFKNLNNYTFPLRSIDTPFLARKRARFTRNLAEKTRILQIRGGMKFICETISDLL